jgi:IclR family transcriptional regulator, acetate operon repressor
MARRSEYIWNAISYRSKGHNKGGVVAAHTLVDRAIDIVEFLADHPNGSSVTGIAQGLAMPASAAHRLLITLAKKRIVEQDNKSKEYKLTLAIPALGLRYLSSFTFMEVCRPTMEALARETSELVRLGIVSSGELIWIAKAQGSQSSLRIDPLEGRSAIPHVTAAGKAWLASMPDEQVTKLVTAGRLGLRNSKMFGPNAISSIDRLIADLDACRRRGYATTYEEAEPGVAAVGAVFRNGASPDAPVVGTISVAGPNARIRRKDLEQMARPVLDAAFQLSSIWPTTLHLRIEETAVATGGKRA